MLHKGHFFSIFPVFRLFFFWGKTKNCFVISAGSHTLSQDKLFFDNGSNVLLLSLMLKGLVWLAKTLSWNFIPLSETIIYQMLTMKCIQFRSLLYRKFVIFKMYILVVAKDFSHIKLRKNGIKLRLKPLVKLNC